MAKSTAAGPGPEPETFRTTEERIEDAVLALLYLGLHDGRRAWKGFDWGALDRLHGKDMISNPVGQAKSVVFTEKGLERAKALFDSLFVDGSGAGA
ncbi:DUF6429 family protein [Labrys monachus]|uniref:DUF6429 domain-containing protein n=1 Tax=Labrys monachus TaxID=217067 RepID=A0ABU0F7T3_9HYPH|nr:DUF6429 family protein [Labrys monachus]MDQ0390673.1 hypothetical protein [Labrys monachus]